MRTLILVALLMSFVHAQTPPIEPGVSHELAKWRAAHYSDVRYKLNLTLEKMSPVLKGTIEVRVNVRDAANGGRGDAVIVLDWRKIRGNEEKSTISNVSINGTTVRSASFSSSDAPAKRDEARTLSFEESNEHLIFRDGVVLGENVIKLDFTSPILTSGSAITRYIDKEDGSEYIYSLFVPSDASTAFPLFDQPDLKARFELSVTAPYGWTVVTNNDLVRSNDLGDGISDSDNAFIRSVETQRTGNSLTLFGATEPISSYVFAFAAGNFATFDESDFSKSLTKFRTPRTKIRSISARDVDPKASGSVIQLYQVNEGVQIYVRKSQAAKFQSHATEVFRLNREGIKFLETYFDYKFPFPKYDLVLIPEFPFGGMEHAGVTFLREAAVIFPQEPTKNDYISRANVIFHEAAHQWFGDTVTMKWFDDLWLKEGFAEFMAYKTLEKVMPEYNAWKVFYERNKQAAYLTDSTKGTTPIYQEIANLSAAKSAYGNIVYRKAPSFLKQAEFYIGPDKFQSAVRTFLRKHEFGNAGWEDLVDEFEVSSDAELTDFAEAWVKASGMPILRLSTIVSACIETTSISQTAPRPDDIFWRMKIAPMIVMGGRRSTRNYQKTVRLDKATQILNSQNICNALEMPIATFPNYGDYGYGIFLLDEKSRDYVLKNIQNEKDEFLRSMMWGSLWDSVREGELDPKAYVELVEKVLSFGSHIADCGSRIADCAGVSATDKSAIRNPRSAIKRSPGGGIPKGETDEGTIATLLGRVSTAMTYYLSDAERNRITPRLEALLIDRMRNASTLGQRITYYRAFLSLASTDNARRVLKQILKSSPQKSGPGAVAAVSPRKSIARKKDHAAPKSSMVFTLKTKDRFDIVTRLLILNDPEAPKLLADLERSETSDEAKRYAYAAKAGIATAENKAKFWNDFVNNKDISESWIEAAFVPFNSVRHADLTLPYLERALKELPNHKRNRKIFFINGWLGAFIGGQKSGEALAIVNGFLAENPDLDRDLRLKILENVDVIERAVKIRGKFGMR